MMKALIVLTSQVIIQFYNKFYSITSVESLIIMCDNAQMSCTATTALRSTFTVGQVFIFTVGQVFIQFIAQLNCFILLIAQLNCFTFGSWSWWWGALWACGTFFQRLQHRLEASQVQFFSQNWLPMYMQMTKTQNNDEKSDENPPKSARKVPFFALWPELRF